VDRDYALFLAHQFWVFISPNRGAAFGPEQEGIARDVHLMFVVPRIGFVPTRSDQLPVRHRYRPPLALVVLLPAFFSLLGAGTRPLEAFPTY
jgi:hypothetical protein